MSLDNWKCCRNVSPGDWGLGGTTARRFGEDGRERASSELRWNSFLPTVNQRSYNQSLVSYSNRKNTQRHFIVRWQSTCCCSMSRDSSALYTGTYSAVNQTSDIQPFLTSLSLFPCLHFVAESYIFPTFLLPTCFDLHLSPPLPCSVTIPPGISGSKRRRRCWRSCARHLVAPPWHDTVWSRDRRE